MKQGNMARAMKNIDLHQRENLMQFLMKCVYFLIVLCSVFMSMVLS